MMSVDCLLSVMQEGYVPPPKKKRSKSQSASQSSHDDQSNDISTPAIRQSEDDENRLENNQVKVRSAYINFQT
jgi:hypothetical protein